MHITQENSAYKKSNSNPAYSGFNTTLVFSGSDVVVSIGSYTLDAISFVQVTPQQMMTPVYSIFQSSPSGFLEGNQLIRGVIGLNMKYVNYFESLATLKDTKMFVTVLENGVVEANEMLITFRGRDYEPSIKFNDVYIFGGSFSANVEGTPIQTVHEFTAMSMIKEDMLSNSYYSNVSAERSKAQSIESTTKKILPSMKPLQGKSVSFSNPKDINVQSDGSINLRGDSGNYKLANVKSSVADNSKVQSYMSQYANKKMGYYTNGSINPDGTQNAILFDNDGNNINAKSVQDGALNYSPNINVGNGYNEYMKDVSTQ